MIEFLKKLFKFLSVEFTVMLTAAIPLIEVKGAIPVPFILFGIRPIFFCGKPLSSHY